MQMCSMGISMLTGSLMHVVHMQLEPACCADMQGTEQSFARSLVLMSKMSCGMHAILSSCHLQAPCREMQLSLAACMVPASSGMSMQLAKLDLQPVLETCMDQQSNILQLLQQ